MGSDIGVWIRECGSSQRVVRIFPDVIVRIRIELPHALTSAFSPEKGTYFDITAAVITLIITFLLTRGVKEAARANGIMVAIKIIVVLIFIGVGVFYVEPTNWQPFLPFGISGVTAGAATVFLLTSDLMRSPLRQKRSNGHNGICRSVLLRHWRSVRCSTLLFR